MEAKQAGKVNIAEVARLAGVSKMTVSRVINNRGNVAPKTVEKVMELIEQLGYRPSALAQGLATNRTNIIGMMLYESKGTRFFEDMVLGISGEAHRNGYDILFFANSPSKKHYPRIRSGLIDGLIAFGMSYDDADFEYFDREQVPYVVIGRRNWKRLAPCSVTTNYRGGYEKAVEYLTAMGHRKIGMCGGIANFEADQEKYNGFLNGMKKAGLVPVGRIYDNELDRLQQLFATQPPSAMIVQDANAWSAILAVIRNFNLSVPTDISLIGGNLEPDHHTLYHSFGISELTSIRVPKFQLGVHAAKRLLSELNGEADLPREIVLDVIFTPGESCCPPA